MLYSKFIYTYNIMGKLFERAAFLIILLFILTRIQGFRRVFQKNSYEKKDLIILCMIFSVFSIIANYTGIDVEGSLVNTRIITIISGGILFGPVVGITTGVVAGLHRYLINIQGVTSFPCLISSIVAGLVAGYINKKIQKNHMWIAGIIAGMFCEGLTMIFILILSVPHQLGIDIVSKISIPMILGEVNVGFIVLLIQSVEDERDKIAGTQAKLALDIANKTLPYFRSINSESLKKICTIIKGDIKADAVAITDEKYILAYVGEDEEYYDPGKEIITEATKRSIKSGKIEIINDNFDVYNINNKIKSAIIIPLKDKEEVIGTLKIYYKRDHKITYSLECLAVGLSQIISTLMEVSKVEHIREMANKAEIRALQTKINPHFLFNALNAITSFIRINPDKARELIINLSSYLRYNIDIGDKLIDIKSELKQVRDYIEIEKARFGDKLKVIYDIDEVHVKIPSLIIEPLVENAVIHGILKVRGQGIVKISVKDCEDKVKITIEDTGPGISDEIIDKVYNDSMPENKIGIYNVHARLKLIYGEGLKIEKLQNGTKIEFYVRNVDE
ncbi:sensor histidine kinase [Clostridium pasteurianum]|uniref:sensor histidine kinase n=1 Tax=Clostridium pasteurianum TaxID=1501 RepID=UPI0022608FF2|nr:sensor histidine kinase [Clostridium pasteurianum]UZW13499.1 sensor histidine kinase [Clostridium pasteurianum]